MVLITLIGHLQVSPRWDLPTNFFQQVACGSHCRIFYEQLTPIQETVNGWKKAKIKHIIYSWYSPLNEVHQSGSKHKNHLKRTVGSSWLYANCEKGVFTSRSKEYFSALPQLDGDKSPLRIHSVFDKRYKFASMTKGMRFQRWEAMCPVMDQSD